MSFLVTLALGIAALAAAPLIAHLLRRGKAREQPFPPARLVPQARSLARESRRLEDRLLFAIRAALIVLLALLGATPLVQCSRLSVERAGGASVALAIVLDDSLSMRARLPSGDTRWERAKRGALELARSARRGDALGVVLAGRPARVLVPPTTDLDVVRRALSELGPTDRGTDLGGALRLAHSLIAELPQRDKQVALLSDFAAEPLGESGPAFLAPLPELATKVENCGVVSAERRGTRVEATVACTSATAARGRSLEALPFDPRSGERAGGGALATAPLAARGGTQVLSLTLPSDRETLGVRLTGTDALEHDDTTSVGREAAALTVGVHADPARASPSTGGRTLIEQALEALGGDVAVRPLAVFPEDPKELAAFSVLLLDDPTGLGPEARAALDGWLARGKVAAAFLGPRAERVQLGSTLEPFAHGAVRWEETRVPGLDPESVAWLGPEAAALADIRPRGRCLLEGGDLPGAKVRGRFQDGAPFLLAREHQRGLVLTFALPTSADESDFSLRPAFLAFLDHLLDAARERSGPARSEPGTTWRFPATSRAEVLGPGGPLPATETARSDGERLFTPELAGRYRVTTSEGTEERTVVLDPLEITTEPRPAGGARAGTDRAQSAPGVDVTPEVVLVLLALLAVESALRIARLVPRLRRREERAAAE